MPKFTDNQGREWDLKLTIPAAEEVKKQFDIDLFAKNQNGFLKLAKQPVAEGFPGDVVFLGSTRRTAINKPDSPGPLAASVICTRAGGGQVRIPVSLFP